MPFLNQPVADSITSDKLPATIDVVTALHACNTATDDAIHFALEKKAKALADPLAEIWRHPLHTREFGR